MRLVFDWLVFLGGFIIRGSGFFFHHLGHCHRIVRLEAWSRWYWLCPCSTTLTGSLFVLRAGEFDVVVGEEEEEEGGGGGQHVESRLNLPVSHHPCSPGHPR